MASSKVFVCVALVALVSSAHALNCLFVTGIGQDGPGTKTTNKMTDPNYARPSLTSYWGPTADKAAAAGCTKSTFYWTDTISRGWDDLSLQQEYCGIIVQTNADVLFGHSMAGMIIAGGIQNKVPGCERIGKAANQVHWYGLQNPMKGSLAANALVKLCENPVIATFAGKNCAKVNGQWQISKAYSSLMVENAPGWLSTTATSHMQGNMCGVIPDNNKAKVSGLLASVEKGAVGLALKAVTLGVAALNKGSSQLTDWVVNQPTAPGSPVPAVGTDGMVDWTSCRIVPAASYRKDPTSPYYVLEGNHGDGRCTYGDDPSNQNFQPCAYIQNMIKRSAAIKGAAPARPVASAPVPAAVGAAAPQALRAAAPAAAKTAAFRKAAPTKAPARKVTTAATRKPKPVPRPALLEVEDDEQLMEEEEEVDADANADEDEAEGEAEDAVEDEEQLEADDEEEAADLMAEVEDEEMDA